MKVTAETMSAIQRAVKREAGCSLRPEERFDISQEVALRLVSAPDPEEVEALIKTFARNLINDRLKTDRIHREALEHLYTVGSAPSYHTSVKRDPMANYMTVKPVLRGSGENEVEDAIIAAIDARTRKGVSAPTVPTCSQNIFAREAILAKRLKDTSQPIPRNGRKVP